MIIELNQGLNSEVTVGLDAHCGYQPSELAQAMAEHKTLYLTNEFTIDKLQINDIKIKQSRLHLIGGFDDCQAAKLGLNSDIKTKITGGNESAGLVIDVKTPSSIVVENFDITGGNSDQAGGVAVFKADEFILKNVRVYSNLSQGMGGGIHVFGDGIKADIINSQIFNNVAINEGGGIAISGNYNKITFNDSQLNANQSNAGGALSCQNHNQINVVSNHVNIDTWASDNQANLAKGYYFDLSCELHLTSKDARSADVIR